MKKKKEKENISETEDIEATSINGEDSVDEQTSQNSIKDSETSDSEQNKEKVDNQEEKSEDDKDIWKDKYIRLYAEFENYKKRTLKEKTELILNGSEKTITAILPVLDDFERALDNKADNIDSIKEGFELILKKFIKSLETLGVRKINTDNQDFNVDYHEAIAMVPGVEDDKKGKIIDCVQTGYTLNDKVIRHAKVAVGQ